MSRDIWVLLLEVSLEKKVTKYGGEKGKSKNKDQQIPLQAWISSSTSSTSTPSTTPLLIIASKSLISRHLLAKTDADYQHK